MTAEPLTEQREARHADLDLRSTLELVELINDEDARVAPAVRAGAAELATAIDAIAARMQRGGRLIYVGAGTSGRLAAADAAECCPTFGLAEGRIVALTVVDEADEDDEPAGAAVVADAGVGAGDAVVALSASGETPYVVGALRAAAHAGALTVAVACTEGSELGRIADHEIVALTGAEVVAARRG